MDNIRITSFNCKNVKTSLPDIHGLCDGSDIVFLQETWLAPSELDLLKSIHSDFYGIGVSSFGEDEYLVGRPHGGLGILWRKSLGSSVKCSKFGVNNDEKRILGLTLSGDQNSFFFLNVYLPCFSTTNSDDNYHEFMRVISEAVSLVQSSPTLNAIILGDFNACFSKPTLFTRELISYCDENRLVISDSSLLQPNSFTFYSDAHQTTSWLDHCISTLQAHQSITNMSIQYDVFSSDHFPLTVSLQLPFCVGGVVSTPASPAAASGSRCVPCWDRATDEDLAAYKERCNQLLSTVHFPREVLFCSDIRCQDVTHRAAIDDMYNDISNCLLLSASQCIPSRQGGSHSIVPGWNDYVKERHEQARSSFLMWARQGKPRQGPFHQQMVHDRALFKYALRACKREVMTIRADKLASSHLSHSAKEFWQEVKVQSCRKTPLADCVDGAVGCQAISNMWAEHYAQLFNSSTDFSDQNYVMNYIDSNTNNVNTSITEFSFSTPQVAQCLKTLKRGKSPGPDGLSSEHFLFAPPVLSCNLSLCFNASLIHGYLPSFLMNSIIVPVIKDKTGVSSDKSNYRPIALCSIISKLLESVILKTAAIFLSSSDYQFAFKSSHSTDMCVYALKEVVGFYLSHSSPVFACFLDASKAFDKVNHWSLFRKLCDRNVPVLLIRLLLFWYQEQSACVRWGNAMSYDFRVNNGVRQGGILSPVVVGKMMVLGHNAVFNKFPTSFFSVCIHFKIQCR